jgi:cobalamin-dependent methionine synthase I
MPESFSQAKKISVFLSTLGPDIVKLVDEYTKAGKVFDAFLLDSWASESLEALNDSFDRKLREEFGEGTRRFSPGYGKVDVRMNRYIVEELLEVDSVKVLESGFLVPRKTTTCMIGWLS